MAPVHHVPADLSHYALLRSGEGKGQVLFVKAVKEGPQFFKGIASVLAGVFLFLPQQLQLQKEKLVKFEPAAGFLYLGRAGGEVHLAIGFGQVGELIALAEFRGEVFPDLVCDQGQKLAGKSSDSPGMEAHFGQLFGGGIHRLQALERTFLKFTEQFQLGMGKAPAVAVKLRFTEEHIVLV